MMSDYEFYVLNLSKRLIFHIYDDRRPDIIATDKETLRPIYDNYRDWIIDYTPDIEKMTAIFKEKEYAN